MLQTVLVVVVIIVAATLLAAALRPAHFTVERRVAIAAPADKVYPLLADFREWPAWSPWEKLDPAMKRTLSGASAGRGAVYAWEGSRKVGAGRMEITDVAPASKVVIQLDFLRPFEAHNITEFTLAPGGDGTEVQWMMRGASNFTMKVMSVFTDMDKMIGRDFETGLANLKAAAEK